MAETFISRYLRYTADFESPGSFWKWSAYATIAAVLSDRCWMGSVGTKLYPNIYVLFLAKSGRRKGKPIEVSEELVKQCRVIKTISGRTSIQALLDAMSQTQTDPETNKILFKGHSAIFYAPEFSAGLVNDPEAIGIFTDIYDQKPNGYESRLRHGPNFSMPLVILSMLGGSNEEMLKNTFYDDRAKKGGFLGRTFLVVPNEVRPPNAHNDKTPEQLAEVPLFVSDLRKISTLKGEFAMTDCAKALFKEWYDPFYYQNINNTDATGYLARAGIAIKKISMLLAANDSVNNSDKEKMLITETHIEQAKEDCLNLVENYNKFIMGSGQSDTAKAGGILMPELVLAPAYTLSRKKIMMDHWQDFTGEILDKLMVDLVSAGMISQAVAPNGSVSYTLTKQALEMLEGPPK